MHLKYKPQMDKLFFTRFDLFYHQWRFFFQYWVKFIEMRKLRHF